MLKLCHGEKECHEMEQLREDKTRCACIQSFCKVNNQKQQLRQDNITTAFPAKGNLVVKYCKCCICRLFLLSFLVLCYYPNPPFFRMIHFCARRDVDCCALYHGISSSYSTQIFTIFTFPVLEIGPWAIPINDRLMFRLTMINVKNKSPIHISIYDDSC